MARPSRGRDGITVEITGLDRLADRIGELSEEILAAARKAVKESAEDVQRETLLNVRKDTGNLQRWLKVRYRKEGLHAEVGWFNKAAYYAWFHEFGTKTIKANPALGPAIEAERHRIGDRISDEVRRALP